LRTTRANNWQNNSTGGSSSDLNTNWRQQGSSGNLGSQWSTSGQNWAAEWDESNQAEWTDQQQQQWWSQDANRVDRS